LQDQVTTIRQNFVKDQRPYLWFTNENVQLQWDKDRAGAVWTHHFTNYGKSPAVEFGIEERLIVGADAMKRIEAIALPYHSPKNVVPQSKNQFASAFVSVSQEDFTAATQHDGWIVLFGTFIYSDSLGNRYLTDFCHSRLASGAIYDCEYDHTKTKSPN
jgi:hypothetical protein